MWAERVDTLLALHNMGWRRLPGKIAEAAWRGDIEFGPRNIHINTLEGRMTANPDDWLILGTEGELYPCKPEVFEKCYERIERITAG